VQKMKLIRSIVTLLFLLSFSACSLGKYDRQAAEFRQRSPITEAESDYRADDYRIYSAMGVGRYFPGLEYEVGSRIAKKYGEIMLPGTSDALESRSHANYVGVATEFASTYNKRKASLIAQNVR
jgi:hypothetical protein